MTDNRPADPPDLSDFGRTVDKLRKINAALMKRVERSMEQQANAFSLFQTAISQEAQIKLRTEELNHALSKLAHTNVELSAARDAAERANRFKTRFFTAAGHDLLQPLHAARLTLSRADGRARSADNRRLTQNISNALTTIEELLTSILDISKLEAGVFVPNFQTVALCGIFEQLAGSLEPMTRRKHLDFRRRPTRLGVRSDPLMLRRMLQNLLGECRPLHRERRPAFGGATARRSGRNRSLGHRARHCPAGTPAHLRGIPARRSVRALGRRRISVWVLRSCGACRTRSVTS